MCSCLKGAAHKCTKRFCFHKAAPKCARFEGTPPPTPAPVCACKGGMKPVPGAAGCKCACPAGQVEIKTKLGSNAGINFEYTRCGCPANRRGSKCEQEICPTASKCTDCAEELVTGLHGTDLLTISVSTNTLMIGAGDQIRIGTCNPVTVDSVNAGSTYNIKPGHDCPTFTASAKPINGGAVCSFPNGKCDERARKCRCHADANGQWHGDACDKKRASCPKAGGKECAGHGRCDALTGKCHCSTKDGVGFTGNACETLPTLQCKKVLGAQIVKDHILGSKVCNGAGICKSLNGIASCSCKEGFMGIACEKLVACVHLNCRNGRCITSFNRFAMCFCKAGYSGKTCEIKRTCPATAGKTCSGNGTCLEDTLRCKCLPGYGGHDCSTKLACRHGANGEECSGNTSGKCHHGICKCLDGFVGSACEHARAKACNKGDNGKECSGRGKCDFGRCRCEPGFTGAACEVEEVMCPFVNGKVCSGNGDCAGRSCVCKPGFASGLRGACENMEAWCPKGPGATGRLEECSYPAGKCDRRFGTATCRCADGRSGNACELEAKACPVGKDGEPCSGVGGCLDGRCVCPLAFKGAACDTELACPKGLESKECSGRGKCDPHTKICRCEGKASGADCGADQKCSDCSGHGRCDSHVSIQNSFAGVSAPSIQKIDLQCKCEEGFAGKDCEINLQECPADAAGKPCSYPNGKCDRMSGKCRCAFGNSGNACEKKPGFKPCPDDCNGRGECIAMVQRTWDVTLHASAYHAVGFCKCEKGAFGRACENAVRDCPRDLNNNMCSGAAAGRCDERTGTCVCKDTWSGDACNVPVLPEPCPSNAAGVECSGRGPCDIESSSCLCRKPFFGKACEQQLNPCPKGERKVNGRSVTVECAGNGHCDRSGIAAVCVCRRGYSGSTCGDKKQCPAACTNGGKCNPFTGKCMCRYGFSGTACETACPSKNGAVCSGRGRCGTDGRCTCANGFGGADCSVTPCPMDEAGVQCSGNGDCSTSPRSGRPRCACNEGFAGFRCSLDVAKAAERNELLRAKVNEAIKVAGMEEQERAACIDDAKRVLCPDVEAVDAAKRGTCVATRKECGAAAQKAACKANAQMRWCGVSCISKKLRCPRTRACKRGAMRCADGSCAYKASRCPSAAATALLCEVPGEVPCGDGVTCAADAAACRKAVQLDGCPVGLFACPSNPKECRASKKDCLCFAPGKHFCGWQRNSAGRLLKEEFASVNGETGLRKVPKCAAKCSGNGKNPLTAHVLPKSVSADPTANTTATLNATAGDDDGSAATSVGAIKIRAGAVASVGDTDAVVTFAIKPAALSDVLEGALKGRDLMSTAVTIDADQVIKIDPDLGIEIDLCVADDAAQSNPALCAVVLQRLRPFSSQDVTADDAKEVTGGCVRGTACGCSCRFVAPHLTTFAVVDADVEIVGEPSADQLAAGVEVLAAETPGGDNMCRQSADFKSAAVAFKDSQGNGVTCREVGDIMAPLLRKPWGELACTDIPTIPSFQVDGPNWNVTVQGSLNQFATVCCGSPAKTRCADRSNMCRNSTEFQSAAVVHAGPEGVFTCDYINAVVRARLPKNWDELSCAELNAMSWTDDGGKVSKPSDILKSLGATCCGGLAQTRCAAAPPAPPASASKLATELQNLRHLVAQLGSEHDMTKARVNGILDQLSLLGCPGEHAGAQQQFMCRANDGTAKNAFLTTFGDQAREQEAQHKQLRDEYAAGKRVCFCRDFTRSAAMDSSYGSSGSSSGSSYRSYGSGSGGDAPDPCTAVCAGDCTNHCASRCSKSTMHSPSCQSCIKQYNCSACFNCHVGLPV
jgi:hypothetical protein